MRSSQRIRQVLSRYQRKPNPQQGILGNEIGEISVPNRVDFVYVRVAGLGTISVYNKRVPLILDLPVDVGYDPLEPKNFQVLNIHRYPQGGGRGLVDVATILHGKTHNWAGIDPVYIEKRQLMPLRPTPLGGMQLYVTREVTYYDDKAVIVTGQQLDLTPYIPATGSLMVLIYKDTDEIVKVQTGGVLRDIFSLTLSDAPQAYPGTVPIALVRLYGGQTGIAEGYQDTDLIDVRQLFSPIDATGTAGSGHVIQDEGSNLPARTNLNFKGALVWATDNVGADSTDIIISGTSGGISTGTTLADHDHSGDAGDGGAFPLVNLQSTGAAAGRLPVANGSGGITWKAGLDWFNVEDYGAVHNNSTDDTAAIQAAIDAAEAAGGGVVYFPAGIYIIGGALQDGSGANAQLLLPSVDIYDDPQMGITLLGEFQQSHAVSVVGTIQAATGGAILKSTLNAGAGGALLGGYGPVGTYENFTFLTVHIENLTFQMPNNPVLSALNLGKVTGVELINVWCNTGEFSGPLTEPTTATSWGIILPKENNSAWNVLRGVSIHGFYNGLQVNEHTDGDQVNIGACKKALVFLAGGASSRFGRLHVGWSPRVLVFEGGAHYVVIDELNIESYGGDPSTWHDPVYIIDDANNYGYGWVWWHRSESGTGVIHDFEKNGGTNLDAFEIGVDTPGGVTTDEKAKVSSNDTTAGYLNGKLVAGARISLTEGNNGGNETLTIAATITGYHFELLQENGGDHLQDSNGEFLYCEVADA